MKEEDKKYLYKKLDVTSKLFLSIEPRIKIKTSFLTHMAHIIQKWHFTAIFSAFIDYTTFCTLMITKLLLLFLLRQATTTNTYSRAQCFFNVPNNILRSV